MDGSWTFGAPADLIAAPSRRKRPRDAADISEVNPGQQLHDARVAFTVPKPAYRRYPSMPTEQSLSPEGKGGRRRPNLSPLASRWFSPRSQHRNEPHSSRPGGRAPASDLLKNTCPCQRGGTVPVSR